MNLFKKEISVYENFEEAYSLYFKAGVIFLQSILKDKEEAENLVQEVFIKLWLRKDKLDFDQNLKSYIYTSLRNIAFDYLKQLERDESMKKNYLEKLATEAIEEEPTETDQIVSAAIEQLSEKRKLIIKLNFEEGKSYQEIANIMNISKNTVKNQLIKAKQHLRLLIKYPISSNS